MKLFVAVLILCLVVAARALGTPVIVVGNHDLQPNLAGQTIQIFVSGGDLVQGIDFNVQVGDGGAATGGTDTGPIIQDVDVLSGIFLGNNTGQTDGSSPLLWNSSTTTDHDTVSASGLLAILTIDTTGLPIGTVRSLSLTPADEFGGATTFAGVPIDITNGSITVVPEPATIALGFLGLVVLGGAARRKRHG